VGNRFLADRVHHVGVGYFQGGPHGRRIYGGENETVTYKITIEYQPGLGNPAIFLSTSRGLVTNQIFWANSWGSYILPGSHNLPRVVLCRNLGEEKTQLSIFNPAG